MSYTLSFGKHEGKTHEWVFFKDPAYAQFIYENGIHQQRHNMDEDEGEHFLELYTRACSLSGICRDCNERRITRLGLTWQRNGSLGMVGFYCDECEYMGGSATAYHPPSFFVEAHELEDEEQKRIVKEIRRIYIGMEGNLTQAKMEGFFHNDANFRERCRFQK